MYSIEASHDNIDTLCERYKLRIEQIHVIKEKRKSKPKKVKLPSVKKPSRSISYAITALGRDYLKVILEQRRNLE